VRSLFAKILVWFVAGVVITVLATTVTSIVSYKPSSNVRAPFSLFIGLEAEEAQHAWETGGREKLAETLGRFLQFSRARGALFTDANGSDLVTGESRPEMIAAAHRHPSYSFNGDKLIFSRFSPDGKYCFFLTISPWRLFLSNLQPAHLLVVLIVMALCYALAYHLTSPLRSLQRAVERFGHGDLSTRAPERRHDEVGELARSFNHMAEHLQTMVSAQQRLLQDISHELRSPLSRLSVAIELARTDEGAGTRLDRIQKEADRMNELIEQMLEVARLESNPAERKVEEVRLDELIGSLVDDCTIEAQVRGCSLKLETGAVVCVAGDRELLRRAIENVVRNAIRYAPSETKVEVALENGAGRARVKVRDYGPGVPDAALGRLFDPFYRVESDRNRESGGAGLGLSIARRAVELHQGSVRASNAEPGLLVEIELPA
jgi:signal transduction histidine kinase